MGESVLSQACICIYENLNVLSLCDRSQDRFPIFLIFLFLVIAFHLSQASMG
jgi:hypothetical protein